MSFEEKIPLLLKLGLREEVLPKVKTYLDLVWAANRDLNIVSRQMSFEDLLDNHLIDCLLPLNKFPAIATSVADFGSGGGFPGVIYALQFPKVQFHLFEKSPKKQDFLKRCKALAPNLNFHGDIPPDLKNIDLVVARAFKPLDVLITMSRNYYSAGGKYFLLKARLEKINEEIELARKTFKDLKVTIEPLTSPVLEVERHLLLI